MLNSNYLINVHSGAMMKMSLSMPHKMVDTYGAYVGFEKMILRRAFKIIMTILLVVVVTSVAVILRRFIALLVRREVRSSPTYLKPAEQAQLTRVAYFALVFMFFLLVSCRLFVCFPKLSVILHRNLGRAKCFLPRVLPTW